MADQIISFAVKGIAGAIGLASEGIKAHNDKKRAKSQTRETGSKNPEPLSTPSRSPSSDENHRFEDKDEDQWALDDVQDEFLPPHPPPPTPESSDKPIRDVRILIDIFFQRHSLQNLEDLPPVPRLPFPVVLPQRRPHTRSRGFIRAYAPVLMNAGIDQAMFLDYLELFDKASQASPWLNAINLAGLAFSFLPTGISMAISVAIALSVKVAIEMQSRSRTNTFLDRLNDEFFRPRGLFCLILTWNPESPYTHHDINLTTTLTSASATPSSGTQKLHHRFQSSSGSTYGELSFPETAPLIFPALEHFLTDNSEHALKTKEKLLKKSEFVANYWDKRAQAKYMAENPDSMLVTGPKPEFRSRYADPDSAASSGNLFSLLSGGHFNPPSRREMMQRQGGFGGVGYGYGGLGGVFAARQEMMMDRRDMMMGSGGFGNRAGMMGYDRSRAYGNTLYHPGTHMAGGSQPRTSMDEREYDEKTMDQQRPSMDGQRSQYLGPNYNEYGRQQRYGPGHLGDMYGGLGGLNAPDLLKKSVKKVLGKNVLYMLIVNMPSDEEMVVANEHADAAEEEARRQM